MALPIRNIPLPSSRAASDSRGFSLIEIIVVIFLLGLIAAITVPTMTSWRKSMRYKEAAWDILSQARLARQLAITKNREYRIEFDIDGKRYRVQEGNAASGSTTWTDVKGWKSLDQEVSWATGSACNGTADMTVKFYPNGTADSATLCILDSDNSARYKIVVTSTSGRVRIETP